MSEEQVCKEVIEQVGYQEFYRYFQEKTTLIEQQRKEIERLNNIINKAIEYLESYNTDFKHSRFNEAPISIRELGDLLDILKGSNNNEQ